MEPKLKELFDYQKFEKNGRISTMMEAAEHRLEARTKQSTPGMAEKISQQRERLFECAKLLQSSKSQIDSPEYKLLTDLTQAVGEGRTIKGMENLSLEERFSQELQFVNMAAEKYAKQKAKDGVDKSVYAELLAVEKTSKTVKESREMLKEAKSGIGLDAGNASRASSGKKASEPPAVQKKSAGKGPVL